MRGGGGGGGLILILKLSFKLFIVGKSVSNNIMFTDNASYKLEANLKIFDSWEWSVCKLALQFRRQTGNKNEENYQYGGLDITPNFSGPISTNVWFWFGELTFRSWEWKGEILYLNFFVFALHNAEDWKLFGFISSSFPTANSLNCLSVMKPITEQFAAIAPQVFFSGVAYHSNNNLIII